MLIRNVRWPNLDTERAERRIAWACFWIMLAAWAGVLAAIVAIWWQP